LWCQAEFHVSEVLDGHVVLHVSGELDLSTRSLFEARLADVSGANDGDVRVDMADVSFFDAAGLAVLLHARQHLETAERMLLITRPSRSVTRVFEITGEDALFEILG
jgi:anti-anti-sigma factor